jgi:DNA polymerase-3 subunit gamma/tau
MAKALYRKWRPQTWDEVAAQEHVTQTLRNAVINDRVAHAYLFAGPRGTGKTTTARLLAKTVNCLDPDITQRPCNECDYCQAIAAGRFMDLIEIDAASNTSVDDVRDLREKINFSPSQGKFKVYIIDEVHMLSTAAFNAFLKTLEEPPAHAIFILATTEIHKIPATVLSRCQWHEFRRIPLNQIVQYLKEKSAVEGIRVAEPVYTEIARQATGSLRDAISLLDQLTSSDEEITLEQAQQVLGTATSMRVIEIVDSLLSKDAGQGLTHINQALDSGTDPRQLARQLVSYLRNVLLYKMGNQDQIELSQEARTKVAGHAAQFDMTGLLQAIKAFNQATVQELANWHPGLALELAFTTYLAEPEPAQHGEEPVFVADPTPQPAKTKQAQTKPEVKPTLKATTKVSISQVKDAPKSTQTQSKKTLTPTPSEETLEAEPLSEGAVLGDLTLHNIHRLWPKIKSMVGNHNARCEALLNSSKLTGLQENTVILGFSSEILKKMFEKEGNLTLIADILEEVCDQPMGVKCIVTSHQTSSIPKDLKIEKDGMVSTATRDLGGKINSAEQAD